jgi:hypothetical protein
MLSVYAAALLYHDISTMKPTTEYQKAVKALLKPKVRALKAKLRAEMSARVDAAVKEMREQVAAEVHEAKVGEAGVSEAKVGEAGVSEAKVDEAKDGAADPEPLLFIEHFDDQVGAYMCTQYPPQVLEVVLKALKEKERGRCMSFLLVVLELTQLRLYAKAQKALEDLEDFRVVHELAGKLVESKSVGVCERLSFSQLYSRDGLRARVWMYGTDE